jgi:hypothetical protein
MIYLVVAIQTVWLFILTARLKLANFDNPRHAYLEKGSEIRGRHHAERILAVLRAKAASERAKAVKA